MAEELPDMSRRVSQPSQAALSKLTTLESEIETFQTNIADIKAKMEAPGMTKINFIELRNSIRQHAGSLEKFQYVKVDSVITADLNSGKDEAKTRRKACNKACDEIRETMQAVLKELDGIIDGMPDAAPEEKKKKKGGCEVA